MALRDIGGENVKSIEPGRRSAELFFGLVGGVGSNVAEVASRLKSDLTDVGYTVPDKIKLSALMHGLPGPPFDTLFASGKRASIETYMDAGTKLRASLNRGDALALLGVGMVRRIRERLVGSRAPERLAFIFDSFKHPDEIESLRRIYGPAFFAISVYTPHEQRKEILKQRLFAFANVGGKLDDYQEEAMRLLAKDEEEPLDRFGQYMADAFALSDVVIGTDKAAGNSNAPIRSVRRFVELLFGNWTHTPTYDETGMYIAQGSGFRSSSMARQVGAAIVRADGSVLATGENEVPKFGGGLYSADDIEKGAVDGRDHAKFGYDTSDAMRREIVADFLGKLIDDGVLTGVDKSQKAEIASALLKRPTGNVRNAKLMNTIDYVRAVHAESAAIVDCARRGLATMGTTLYTTTFPCHDCAKHIVAAGIERVVYIEPYTKSLAEDFYSDSIVVDDPTVTKRVHFLPFVGVAPRRYAAFFAKREKRKADGLYQAWDSKSASPRLPDYAALSASRLFNEQIEFEAFRRVMVSAGIAKA